MVFFDCSSFASYFIVADLSLDLICLRLNHVVAAWNGLGLFEVILYLIVLCKDLVNFSYERWELFSMNCLLCIKKILLYSVSEGKGLLRILHPLFYYLSKSLSIIKMKDSAFKIPFLFDLFNSINCQILFISFLF